MKDLLFDAKQLKRDAEYEARHKDMMKALTLNTETNAFLTQTTQQNSKILEGLIQKIDAFIDVAKSNLLPTGLLEGITVLTQRIEQLNLNLTNIQLEAKLK